jgi:hypothetical protein
MSLSLKNLRGSPCYGVITGTIIRQRNEARPKIEKQNMKTQNLLIITGAAILAAITLNVNASDTLLSPRAAANQIKTVPGATVVQAAPATGITLSPRSVANQTITVATVANDVNPTIACRNMTASPRAIQACAANPTAAMPCCAKPVATAN